MGVLMLMLMTAAMQEAYAASKYMSQNTSDSLTQQNHTSEELIARDMTPPNYDLRREVQQLLQNNTSCAVTATQSCSNRSSAPGRPPLCSFCSCDVECEEYGDCCVDYLFTGVNTPRHEYSCAALQLEKSPGVLMVTSCAQEYSESIVEQLCLQQVDEEDYQYLLDLPVTSSSTNTTYVNYYCALCNNDAQSLHKWDISISCTSRTFSEDYELSDFANNARYVPGSKTWTFTPNQTINSEGTEENINPVKDITCALQVSQFDNPRQFVANYGGRLCKFPKGICGNSKHSIRCAEQVMSCNSAWGDEEIARRCKAYSFMILVDNVLYKNPHCAMCNNANISQDAHCLSFKQCMRRTRFFKLPQAFSVLMDFSSESCAKHEIYNPVDKECQRVSCGSLFKFHRGKCIPKKKYKTQVYESVLNNSCLKSVHSEETYKVMENNSVYLTITKRVYSIGEYEVDKRNNLLVCDQIIQRMQTLNTIHRWTTFIVLLLSIFCLVLHIIVYILLPKLHNLPGKIMFSLSVCLLVAHFFFLTGVYAMRCQSICFAIGVCLHYFYLSSFCWMNVMSFDVYITFKGNFHRTSESTGRTFLLYCAYGWGVPLLIIIVSLVIEFSDILPEYKPHYGHNICWIDGKYSKLAFFIVPTGIIILANLCLFAISAYGIYIQTKATEFAMRRSQSIKENDKGMKPSSNFSYMKKMIKKEKARMLLYVKLAVIQGLTWSTGLTSIFIGHSISWYIFTVLNGLQGVFIFIFFDIKRKTWNLLHEKFGTGHLKLFTSKYTHNTTFTTSSSSGRKSSAKSLREDDGGNEKGYRVSWWWAQFWRYLKLFIFSCYLNEAATNTMSENDGTRSGLLKSLFSSLRDRGTRLSRKNTGTLPEELPNSKHKASEIEERSLEISENGGRKDETSQYGRQRHLNCNISSKIDNPVQNSLKNGRNTDDILKIEKLEELLKMLEKQELQKDCLNSQHKYFRRSSSTCGNFCEDKIKIPPKLFSMKRNLSSDCTSRTNAENMSNIFEKDKVQASLHSTA